MIIFSDTSRRKQTNHEGEKRERRNAATWKERRTQTIKKGRGCGYEERKQRREIAATAESKLRRCRERLRQTRMQADTH